MSSTSRLPVIYSLAHAQLNTSSLVSYEFLQFNSYKFLLVILENADKKSQLKKKTAISINGQFLPIAKLRTTDKDLHVIVQKAETTGVQLQPTVQEVSHGGQNLGTSNTLGMKLEPQYIIMYFVPKCPKSSLVINCAQ